MTQQQFIDLLREQTNNRMATIALTPTIIMNSNMEIAFYCEIVHFFETRSEEEWQDEWQQFVKIFSFTIKDCIRLMYYSFIKNEDYMNYNIFNYEELRDWLLNVFQK